MITRKAEKHFNGLRKFGDNQDNALIAKPVFDMPVVDVVTSTSPPLTTYIKGDEIIKKHKRMDKGTARADNVVAEELKPEGQTAKVDSTTRMPIFVSSTISTPSDLRKNEYQSKSNDLDGAKNITIGDSNSGISASFGTVWESMKRLMGFSPECHNGGYRSIGSRSCTCPQFFEGHFCEHVICVNGGTRINLAAFGNEEVCKCPNPDYIKGKHCEQVHCQNGGRLLNDGTCHCVDGWYSGQFCQYYTSSWLIAIGMPLLFIAIVIFCCFICRMDLCALGRSSALRSSRSRDRRSHCRRRHHQQQNDSSPEQNNRYRTSGIANDTNRHRREQMPFRLHREREGQQPPAAHFYIYQNLLENQQQQPQQQYVVRLEQIPVYNPSLYMPNDSSIKPLEPPPPYEQAVLCSPPNQYPPSYCTQQTAVINDRNNANPPEANENQTHAE